ncbi:NADH-quinone oxidoreductase subunit B [Candidatus Bathyarchaeota archaeon]|nr:MAG: NADH-quinone oxidoreductase subunit B [Candidatus Bathyarchaeota archaeon]TEU06005.1 MAG: NADH-quinone oxidoreductase subunit B [Candidatus Bathyarchaeota archaeon]
MGLIKWARTKSPWLLHFNSGGCAGCDIEIVAASNPKFDIERFGMLLKGSPRHSDILVLTGPITFQIKNRLKRIYNQMPEPKFVIAIGSCAISGGVYRGCYNVHEGADKVVPVDVYVPGCPPKPEAIIDGIIKVLKNYEKATP